MDDGWRRDGRGALRATLADALAGDGEVALLLVDVDHCLWFNDTFGHVEGDDMLARVWRCIAALGDPVYRSGGDEYTVLRTGGAVRDAPARAEAIRAAVQGLAIPNPKPPGGPGIVTVSVGVATRAAGERDPAVLIARADDHCYAAKAAGRNRVSGA